MDDDECRYPADELRRWKHEAQELAESLFGKAVVVAGSAASQGLIAIGPEVLAFGRVLRTVRGRWTVAVDRFLLGDVASLRHFGDRFGDLPAGDCYACFEADGVGRMLLDAPTTDVTSGVVLELHVAAPLPRVLANDLGADCALNFSGDQPDLDPSFDLIEGAATIRQVLTMHLSTCKGGYCVGGEAGSRVAELAEKLGHEHLEAIITIEIARLATVPHEDTWNKSSYVPFGFVERVRSVRMLPSAAPEWLKAAITVDVAGLGMGEEYVVPISASTKHLGPAPLPPSVSARGPFD